MWVYLQSLSFCLKTIILYKKKKLNCALHGFYVYSKITCYKTPTFRNIQNIVIRQKGDKLLLFCINFIIVIYYYVFAYFYFGYYNAHLFQ